jgi:hypothetical protein
MHFTLKIINIFMGSVWQGRFDLDQNDLFNNKPIIFPFLQIAVKDTGL